MRSLVMRQPLTLVSSRMPSAAAYVSSPAKVTYVPDISREATLV